MPIRDEAALAVPVVAVVGATASGKSALALDVAAALRGEILNTDAMQVYRGMDIGTAKLGVQERRGIPHHLLDLFEIDEVASVGEFQQRARCVIDDCRGRGITPVLVGGSALYTRAILDRFEFPGTDPDVRARWQQRLDDIGSAALHRELAERDPEAAERIEPNNGRRIVRALEAIELTGRPFSASLPKLEYQISGAVQIGVRIPREELERRIEQRVDEMFAAGLVDEVRGLERRGLRDALTASVALGYQQVLAYLAGEITEAEAKAQTVRATRRFARRQDSWFHKDPRIIWVDHDDPDRLAKSLSAIRHELECPV
ncbi:MAG: tRNA (adenosine(37)-N6)-dimethylallyltransferase MiaA [Nocardioidaceae bacterium]